MLDVDEFSVILPSTVHLSCTHTE